MEISGKKESVEMSVNKTANYKIKKIIGMWGTDCKWIEDNFGLDNYWSEEDGVGVLERDTKKS